MYMRPYFCPNCHATYEPNQFLQCCTQCACFLMADYDYTRIRSFLHKEDLQKRANNIWRYKELLPLMDEANIVTKGEGLSPVLALKNISRQFTFGRISIKDDSIMPCSSFKARVGSVIASVAKENGAKTIISNTSILEGLALASYAARAALGCVIITSQQKSHPIYQQAILETGASLYLYPGPSALAASSLAQQAAKEFGWMYSAPFSDPYQFEAKKTIGLEIAEMYDWKLPDVIICPVAYGGAFTGIYRGIRDMQRLGWVGKKLPRLVAVQTGEFTNVVDSWNKASKISLRSSAHYGIESKTVSTTVEEQALQAVLDGVYKSLGCALKISRNEVELAKTMLATCEGISAGPGGASALAAAKQLYRNGWLTKTDRVLLYNAESMLPDCSDSECAKNVGLLRGPNDAIPEKAGKRLQQI